MGLIVLIGKSVALSVKGQSYLQASIEYDAWLSS